MVSRDIFPVYYPSICSFFFHLSAKNSLFAQRSDLFSVVSKEKLEVVEEEHRAQLERLQQKLTEAENKLSRLQQEKQQLSQQSIVRSRSPPDLALQRATEERRPGEVGLRVCCHGNGTFIS